MLDAEEVGPERQKPLRTIREFGNYIAANQAYIPDYGDRHRNGERISSAFTESAGTQLVSWRMVKNNKCTGPSEALTCCCRSARKC